MEKEIKYKHIKAFRELTFDAKLPEKFNPNNAAEKDFARALKKLARAVGGIVESHVDGASLTDQKALSATLKNYSEKIEPWALVQSSKLISRISASNKKAYQQHSRAMGAAMKDNLTEHAVGRAARGLVHEQVGLIKSIPIEAGERAQQLAFEATVNSKRAPEIAKELQSTTDVTESRAVLIARTETARSNAAINQARAQSVGSSEYIWRTAEDADVREAHAEMEGVTCSWDDPPELSDDTTGHPGTFPNCRCYAEPVLSKL